MAKLKYIVLSGDIVDKIGIYPKKQKDLAIFNIDQQ